MEQRSPSEVLVEELFVSEDVLGCPFELSCPENVRGGALGLLGLAIKVSLSVFSGAVFSLCWLTYLYNVPCHLLRVLG